MSEGHPTAPQREVLLLLSEHGPQSGDRLARRLADNRPNAASVSVMRRMVGQITWRLAAQHLARESPADTWDITPAGRAVIGRVPA